jgi:LacI family transcriptional regulator
MRERVRGYKRAVLDHGLNFKKTWMKEVSYANAKKEVEAAIDQLVSKRKEVSALFFATNTLAVYGLKHIDRLKLRVPDDVAVVCFDQGEAFDFYYCPLTYVKQPLVELGTAAVNILIDQISRKNKGYSQTSLEAELIVRDSCTRLEKQMNV